MPITACQQLLFMHKGRVWDGIFGSDFRKNILNYVVLYLGGGGGGGGGGKIKFGRGPLIIRLQINHAIYGRIWGHAPPRF